MHKYDNETFTVFTQEEWNTCNDVEKMLLFISFSDVCPDILDRIRNDKPLESLKIYMDQAYKHQENEWTKSRRLTRNACTEQEDVAFGCYCIYQQKEREYKNALLSFIKKLVPETPVVIRAKVIAYQFKDVKAVNPWTTTSHKYKKKTNER